ncbi:UNVERIFIED_CONTAM: hypothetical protein PYX00_001975 [Menopon gallinae]|uniref:GTPase-activating protein CdGAPr n=1 Tax=Menopon gallinae TaxID=328185 RepID=A0AAW2IGL4_9NEOP
MNCVMKRVLGCSWDHQFGCVLSGLCNTSELESSRGSIRIQHVTGLPNTAEGRSRFPKLDECAHFHYEHVEIGPLQITLVDDDDLKPLSTESDEGKWWSLSVTSQSKTWLIRRSYDNFRMLDQQLHRCIYDRKFSGLVELPAECIEEQENIHKLLSDYVTRFSSIAGSLINCGPVLNWLELDNRGHRLLVPDTDNCPINTPAVAAAYSVKRYTAQAPDEISFEVGDMISVIDMPPPEESIWWRGKKGFQVGFFPCECVAVIGDKVPRNLHFSTQQSQPSKPVLRKHGKLIAFFRSFILSRPSRRRLKQSGILKERVFGCDLGEHLLNSGHEIPMVLKCCAEFIESHGIVDGIYRLSGVTSNIQKLRNAFDEDRVPALYEDEAILQDIHSVASLLKMYFRELPNPLCTYQLYHQFVGAVQTTQGDDTRLLRMRDVVQKLPPPHYRTLEYLMRHLARVAEKGHETGMTPRNVAIVWAPNLLRCKELEVGGVAALQGVGVQAVVTEFLVCYSDLIFCDRLPNISLPPQQVSNKKTRPKSLAISTPTKLLSLEEARTRALLQAAGKAEQDYIEVGGGPASLPAKYHTVIELPGSSRKRPGSKRSPLGWKSLFGKSGRSSQSRKGSQRKASTPSDLGLHSEKAVTESDIAQNRRRLRPAKSVESLNSSRNSANDHSDPRGGLSSPDDTLSPMLLRSAEGKGNGHNRSVSHESYFDQLQDQEDEERFESNLDISEIQVNFDLEESEMRIFSEDETLVSVGSGSLMSNSSPRILPGHKFSKSLTNSVAKRLSYPKLARAEDSLSSSQSADPSPKKQKTSDGLHKKSKLEEQLASSVGDIQFIDSVSPDQVLVQAEVHPIQSPSPVSSISQISSSILPPSSPILPHIPHLQRPYSQPNSNTNSENNNHCSEEFKASKSNGSTDSSTANRKSRALSNVSNEMSPTSHVTSPSLAEATISDNESFSLQSSDLTTPDTPLCGPYAPLLDFEESSLSNTTTPDFDVNEKARKYSSETDNIDKTMASANLEFESYKNIGKEYEKFEEDIIKMSSESVCSDLITKCVPESVKMEVLKEEVVIPPKPEERKQRPVHPYENVPLQKPEVEPRKMLETSFDVKTGSEMRSPTKTDSIQSIKYECISTESSCDSLINMNKNDDVPFLLGKASPVVESVPFKVEATQDDSVDAPCESRDPAHAFGSEEDLLEKEESMIESEMVLLNECCDWLNAQPSLLESPLLSTSENTVLHIKNDDVNEQGENDLSESTEISTSVGDIANYADKLDQEVMGSSVTDNRDFPSLFSESDIIQESVDKSPEEAVERVVEMTDCSLHGVEGPAPEEARVEDREVEVEDAKNDEEMVTSPAESNPEEFFEEKKENVAPCEREETHPRGGVLLETNLDECNEVETVFKSIMCSPKKAEPKPSRRKIPAQKSNSSGNVRQLLSKFEISPTAERDLAELEMEFAERRRSGRSERRTSVEETSSYRRNVEERPKTLERLSSRRKERVELAENNLGKSKSGSNIDDKHMDANARMDALLNCDLDFSDPQRRERIERYKEKRRTYLREKYRSDSFKAEKDDFLIKLKQKHGKPAADEAKPKETPEKRLPPFEKPARKHLPTKTQAVPEKRNPPFEKPARKNVTPKTAEASGRDVYKRSYSIDGSGRYKFENRSLVSPVKEQSSKGFLRMSYERKSASDFRPSKSSPEKRNLSLDFSTESSNLGTKLSPELFVTYSPRRRLSQPREPTATSPLSAEPGKSDEAKCSVNNNEKLPSEGCTTPTYCIKDMTALFERRDDAAPQIGTHKQYLSSV